MVRGFAPAEESPARSTAEQQTDCWTSQRRCHDGSCPFNVSLCLLLGRRQPEDNGVRISDFPLGVNCVSDPLNPILPRDLVVFSRNTRCIPYVLRSSMVLRTTD